MHSSQRRRGAAPKPQQHFNNWNEEESQLGLPTSSPTGTNHYSANATDILPFCLVSPSGLRR
jgi:hypothetical protein